MTAPQTELQGRPEDDVEKTLGIGVHKKRRGWIWLVALAVIVAVSALIIVRVVKARRAAAVPLYETAQVVRADLSVTVTATGTLQGLNTVEVGAEVSGKVTEVKVDYNDHVTAGQLLAIIDPEQSQAALDESNASVAAADASISLAKATVEESAAALARAEQQNQMGLVATKDLEAARATAARAKASYASAIAQATVSRANLKSATSKMGKTKIVAPVTGMVLSRLIEPGATVTAGFTTPVLFKLTDDLRKMSLEVYVDEADVGRVKEGLDATFTVDAYPGKSFVSKVKAIHNEPKTENNVVSYESILTADNADLLLRPGMTATATIVAAKTANALLVPNAALRFTPPAAPRGGFGPPGGQATASEGSHVYVLVDNQPKSVPVKLGATDGTNTEIIEGALEPGVAVIVDLKDTPK